MLFRHGWAEALLLGAVLAPTDAAAVAWCCAIQGRGASRVLAPLEVESGLNDPMSVFLTVGLVEDPDPRAAWRGAAALLFGEEMGGGAVIGRGRARLLWLFRTLRAERSVFPVVALARRLAIFGGAQVLGASGFLAVYLAGLIVGNTSTRPSSRCTRFFGALGWLAQIALFLMLGLLVTPHQLPPLCCRRWRWPRC